MEVEIDVVYDADEKTMDIDLKGDDMGILIGKRGQTLDSLQYLTSLVVNKYTEDYIRVKLDIENYRERRKETLETQMCIRDRHLTGRFLEKLIS